MSDHFSMPMSRCSRPSGEQFPILPRPFRIQSGLMSSHTQPRAPNCSPPFQTICRAISHPSKSVPNSFSIDACPATTVIPGHLSVEVVLRVPKSLLQNFRGQRYPTCKSNGSSESNLKSDKTEPIRTHCQKVACLVTLLWPELYKFLYSSSRG